MGVHSIYQIRVKLQGLFFQTFGTAFLHISLTTATKNIYFILCDTTCKRVGKYFFGILHIMGPTPMEIKTYDTVVKKYRHFFIFVFKYLFPILGVVVCFLLFQKIFLSTVSVRQQDDPFVLQRTKLVASFEKFLKQTIQDHDIDIFILQ